MVENQKPKDTELIEVVRDLSETLNQETQKFQEFTPKDFEVKEEFENRHWLKKWCPVVGAVYLVKDCISGDINSIRKFYSEKYVRAYTLVNTITVAAVCGGLVPLLYKMFGEQ